jgi:hypothetical protein
LKIKPESEWDDLDRAANAEFRGEQLPEGWIILGGEQVLQAIKYVPPKRKRKRGRKLAKSKQGKPMQNLQKAEPRTPIELVHHDAGRGTSDLPVCSGRVDQAGSEHGRISSPIEGTEPGQDVPGTGTAENKAEATAKHD